MTVATGLTVFAYRKFYQQLTGEERTLSFLVGTISNVLVMEIGWTDVLVLFYLFYHIFTVKQSRKLAPDRRTASDKFSGGPVVFAISPDRLSGKLFCQPLPLRIDKSMFLIIST